MALRQTPRSLATLCAVLGMTLTLACAGTQVEDYREQKPEFVLEDFFDGPLVAKGALYDLFGNVSRRFVADIRGTWDGDQGTLDEIFWWADGEEQTRVWKIERTTGKAFEGTAGDIVGRATGRGAGNAFNWNYKLAIPYGDSSLNVRMDDWIYLLDESTVLNRTEMTWYGIQVGEVVLTIQKVDESQLFGRSPFETPTQASATP